LGSLGKGEGKNSNTNGKEHRPEKAAAWRSEFRVVISSDSRRKVRDRRTGEARNRQLEKVKKGSEGRD